MGAYFTYLKLELKKAFQILPIFLTGAVVLALFLGTIALLGSRVLYGESASGRITVAVVLPEDDATARQAVSMVSSLDSVKSLCDFIYLDGEEAAKRLRDGSVYAVMTIPEGWLRGIIDGTNTPVVIRFGSGQDTEALIFRELTSAGARTLGAAQAAIYAADEFCLSRGLGEFIRDVEDGLNRIYIKYALGRTDIFKDRKVSATGDVTALQYYAAAALVLFLLFCGIPASPALTPKRRVFRDKLSLIGIGKFQAASCSILSVFVLLSAAYLILYSGLIAFGFLHFSLGSLWTGVLLCLSVSAAIVFAFELAGSQIAGVSFLFLSSMAMMFISGGFIPSVFLPGGIRALAVLMPTSLMMRAAQTIITAKFSASAFVGLGAMGAVFYILTVAVRRR